MKYSKKDLEKLADEVITLSKDSGDSLVDSVLSVIKDNPMNPEQIKRLVEMSNTNKFLSEFSSTSGEDRFVDFDVLNPIDIIEKALGSLPKDAISSKSKSLSIKVEKVPGGTLVSRKEKNDPGLDTEDSRFFADIEDTKEKSASFYKVAKELSFSDKYDESPALKGDQDKLPDEIQKKILQSKGKELSKEKTKKKLSPHNEKMLEDKLLTKKESAEWECSDLAAKISSLFRGIYSRKKHANYEIECLANFGATALPAMQAVRSKLGMELLNVSDVNLTSIKTASEFYLSDKNSLGMKETSKYIEKLAQYLQACEELKAFYDYTEKTAMIPAAITGALGFGIGANQIMSPYLETKGYEANLRANHWASRIKARDETLKDIRKKVVGSVLDGLESKAVGMFDDMKSKDVAMDQKNRRIVASGKMLKENPDLRAAGKQNLQMAINMVGKVAPELSTSVPFLTAHVKQMVYNSDGGMPIIDAQSIKSMSEAERAFENLGRFKQA